LAHAGQVASKRTNKENVFLIFHLDDCRLEYLVFLYNPH
jgi:hypothetical protein